MKHRTNKKSHECNQKLNSVYVNVVMPDSKITLYNGNTRRNDYVGKILIFTFLTNENEKKDGKAKY